MANDRVKEYVKYHFDDDELNQMGRDIASKSQQQEALEKAKKSAMQDFQAKIGQIQADVSILANNINQGWEERSVECEIKYNDPKPGRKTIYRCDSGESVRTEIMTGPEMQERIPFKE